VLSAADEGEAMRLTVQVRPNEGDNNFRGDVPYRRLTWDDMEALAAADGVQLARDGKSFVLRFARVPS
jgi:hypothetical protein